MNYYKLLEEKAKLGLDELLAYLQTDKNLLYTVDYGSIISVEIETWYEENAEYLMSFEFNTSGKIIK